MAEDTWKEIRSRLEGLGLKLKLHMEQERDETDTTAEPGETRKAVEDLGNRIQETFASFGSAAKDPAIHADMKEIGVLVKDAMMETFANVGAEVSDRFGRTTGSDSGESSAAADDAEAAAAGPEAETGTDSGSDG